MPIHVRKPRKSEKYRMKGFLSLLLTNLHLGINVVTSHRKNGEGRISLSVKPYQNNDGTMKYSHIVKLAAKSRSDKFQVEAMATTEKGSV